MSKVSFPVRAIGPGGAAACWALALALSPVPSEGGEIRGRLLVAGERPAAGVTVSAVPYETPFEESRRQARRQAGPKPLATAQSAADGGFVLSVAADPAGRGFRIKLEGPGVVPLFTGGVYEASESEDVGELSLAQASKLAGRVVDEKGQPVPGAEVTLVSRGGGRPFQDVADPLSVARVTLTGADGSFRFDDARPQGNRLTVEARGYATVDVPNVREGALQRPIVLQPGVSLSGVVRSAGRAPAPGALVRFEGKSESRWVEAGPDGSFRLADLPTGSGTLLADGGELGMAELRGLSLPGSDSERVQVTLAPAAAIEGRVVDSRTGRPIPRVKVIARAAGRVAFARSGPDGRYRIGGLLPQRYRVEADDVRYVPYERAGVVVLSGVSEKVDLPLTAGATLSGRVVDEEGNPVRGAQGRLALGGELGIAAFIREQRAGERSAFRSGADGGFKATRLMPGDNQRLTVIHPEYERRTVGGLSLAPGGSTAGVAVVLSRGLAVAGVVKDHEGAPIPGVELRLTQGRTFRAGRGGNVAQLSFVGGPGERPQATSDEAGRFEMKGLTAGDYILFARKAGYSEAVLDPLKVAEDAEPVEITLGSGASISGVVIDSTGQPAEGYFVQARARGGSDSPMRGGGPRQPTGPDGFFSIDGLRAGEAYELMAMVMGVGAPGPRREAVTAPAEGVELVVPGRGRIAGRVLDAASGQPVTDFEISYNPDRSARGGGIMIAIAGPGGRRGRGPGQREQFHSEDGSFVLDEISPGNWEVNATAKGYQAGRVGGIVVEAGRSKDGVVLRLSQGSGIRGRVADGRSGRPIADARVLAEVVGGQSRPPMLSMIEGAGGVPTDADGMFEIDGLSQGRYVVTAQHPDYSQASLMVDVKEGLAAADLRLSAGGALGGLVISEARRPLAGAEVVLEPAGDSAPMMRGGGGFSGDSKGAVTDEQGRFRFDHLTSGRYRVVAAMRDRSSPPADVVLQPGESRDDVQLVLQAGATIRGRVSGLPPNEQEGVNVSATGPESYFGSTRTAADGGFELGGVPAGTILLRASAGDFLAGSRRSATATVAVLEGQPEAQAEIVFETGYTLTGNVTRAGQPIPDAFVSANVRGGGGVSASSRSDASGGYRLEGLQQGSYNVSVFAEGRGSRTQEVAVEGDSTLDIQIPVARIAGTVVDSASKQPLADATVDVDAGDAAAGGPRLMRGAVTDGEGRFAVEDLEPKPYTVTARRSGFQFEKLQITAAEHGTDELVIPLARGEGIGILARDGIFGVPLRGLTARVLDAARSSVFMGSLSLDSEGRGEIPSIKPGQYTVMVDANGYAPVSFPATVPAPPLAVTLTPGGNLELRASPERLATGALMLQVLDSLGRPYAYSIFAFDGKLALSMPVRLLENFAPGRYTLTSPGAQPQPFAVAEGQKTVVEVR